MVNGQNTDAVLVGELLQLADDFIIAGVTVSLAANLSDFLHRVNDNELGIGMLIHKELKLFVQAVSDFVCRCCEVEIAAVLYAVHHKHTALDSLVIVLQCEIQYRSLMHFVVPQLFACADVICDLCHQEGLANLRRTGEDIRPSVEQAAYNRRSALVRGLIQLGHRNCVQIVRVCHAVHLTIDFFKIFRRIFVRVIDFRIASGYNIISVLNRLPFICANRCCKGSLFFFVNYHRHLPPSFHP